MTTETPCLPECRGWKHAFGCDRRDVSSNANPADPQEVRYCKRCGGQQRSVGEFCGLCAGEPAELPACKCGGGNRIPNVAHTPDGCYSVPAEPQESEGSEPPTIIRVELDHFQTLIAERDALKAEVASLLVEADRSDAENAALKAENMRLAYGHAELQDKVDALKARMEALTVVGRRVVKRRNRHYKDVRDSVDALEAVLAKNACLPTCGTYEHVVEDQHANGCPVLRKEQEASNGK